MPDQISVEVIEKVIDSQIENTKALTTLNNKIDDTNERIKGIEAIMHNGFRSEIKDCNTKLDNSNVRIEKIEKETEKITILLDKHSKLNDKIDKIIEQNKFWARLTSIIVAVGAVAAVVYKLWGA